MPDSDAEEQLTTPTRATFLRSFVFAWAGIVYVGRTQRNLRVHIAGAGLALMLSLALRISPLESAMVVLAVALVFITEMINTVVEACVDLASPGYHELARIAKDVAAGAVLVSAILSVLVGLLVFGPHLVAAFHH